MKKCSKCKEEKELSGFSKDKTKKDGLRSACKQCDKVSRKDYRARKGDFANEQTRKWRQKNPHAASLACKAWRENNPDKVAEYNKKESTKRRAVKAISARRAKKKNCMPSWANEKYIDLFYVLAQKEAERTGLSVEVDHMVPLTSDYVCGLHCEHNMQLLEKSKNVSKGNRHWPDMWEIESGT